ncbi:ankyrin repeat-containing domain protein [Cunninghamella echinulata]|nr:ankyrin repeat-containing domain protein [Cunninghamella echinulata]
MPTLLSQQQFSILQESEQKTHTNDKITTILPIKHIIEPTNILEEKNKNPTNNKNIVLDIDITDIKENGHEHEHKLQEEHQVSQPPSSSHQDLVNVSLSTSTSATSSLSSIPDDNQNNDHDCIRIHVPTISIWTAAEKGDIASLQHYIQQSHDPISFLNRRDPKTECTLLHLAVNHLENPYPSLELLLTHGADPCARNIYNVQVLHTLSLNCPYPRDCIELLLNHGAYINCCDGDGWTPLHYATRFCQTPLPVVQLLVERGSNVNALDSSRKSPIFGLLANGDHLDSLTYLIQHGKANIGICGDFLDTHTRSTVSGTILLQAIKYLRFNCLHYLLDSPTLMSQLRPALTFEELSFANQLLHQYLDQPTTHSSPNDVESIQSILSTLDQLKSSLSQPTSVTSKINKRLSILSSKSDDTDIDTQQRPSLVKRMASLMSRYKKSSNQEDMV